MPHNVELVSGPAEENATEKHLNTDAGAVFDNEIEYLTTDYRRVPSELFNKFLNYLKKIDESAFERLSDITMKGPKNEDDKNFLQSCKTDFIDAVNHGDIKLD